VGRLIEVGIPIRITRRIVARNGASNLIIAEFNIKDDLKPKGMVVYRWCCYYPYFEPTKTLSMKLFLNYGDRDVSEGSQVFLRSKDGGAYGGPLPSPIHKPKPYKFHYE